MLRQGFGSSVARIHLIQIIDQKIIPIAAADHFVLIPEIIQQIGWMGAGCVHLGFAPLMFCCNIEYMVGYLD